MAMRSQDQDAEPRGAVWANARRTSGWPIEDLRGGCFCGGGCVCVEVVFDAVYTAWA